MKFIFVFLLAITNSALAIDCTIQQAIEKENEFLSYSLPAIAKANPKVENQTNLMHLAVFDTYIFLPNRYFFVAKSDGFRLHGSSRGRTDFYGCSLPSDEFFHGMIRYGLKEQCHCERPTDLSGTDLEITDQLINEKISIRIMSSQSLGIVEVYIFYNDEYLRISDSNNELYKHVLYQLNGYKH